MIWSLQDSNGFMVDIRQQPVAMQRAAFRQGLIPYVPADRAAAQVPERISASTSRRLFQFKITLRGIELPPGNHKVEFVFRAHSFRNGAAWSAAGLLLLCIGGVVSVRRTADRRKRRTATKEAPTGKCCLTS